MSALQNHFFPEYSHDVCGILSATDNKQSCTGRGSQHGSDVKDYE